MKKEEVTDSLYNPADAERCVYPPDMILYISETV